MKGKIFQREHRKKLIVTGIITFVCLVVVVAIAISGSIKPKYDYSRAYEFYTENKLTVPNGNGAVLTVDDISEGKIEISAEESGYGRSVQLLSSSSDATSTAVFTANISTAGLYNLKFEYRIISDPQTDLFCAVKVNDDDTNPDHATVPLPAYWRYQSSEFAQDRRGNDILPLQERMDEYISSYARDLNYKDAIGLPFSLKAGVNTIEINLLAGGIYLSKLEILPVLNHVSYNDYYKSLPNKQGSSSRFVIHAEKPLYKNDISVQPYASSDINCYPYHSFNQLINSICTTDAGTEVTYEFEVLESGLYNLGFNYSVYNANTTAFRRIMIDGETPFGEFLHYPFPYSRNYSYLTLNRGGEDLKIFLEKGKHTLTLEVDGASMAAITEPLKEINRSLSESYLQIKKLVGPNPDKNRDWVVYDYFPNIVQEFEGYIKVLEEQRELYMSLNGHSSSTQAVLRMDSALRVLRRMLKEPNSIPNNVGNISEGTDSIVQSISAAVMEIEDSDLDIDAIYITGTEAEHEFKKKNGFAVFWDGIKRFFGSFFLNFSLDKDEDTIEIWANSSLGVINLMQNLAESDFTKKTNIKVNISVLKDEGKLILANASGINPDGIVGISSHLPYEMGIRGLIHDMNNYSDAQEVVSRFSPSSMVPYVIDGKIYGVPETQDAMVMFYRKDIMQSLKLDVPNTWDDVIQILPVLQRNGMNFYTPLSNTNASKPLTSIAPYIYQAGGRLYSDDATKTAIDEDLSIKGLTFMTDLYSAYGLPLQVASFAESFREGVIPIGINSVSMVSQLLISAPELTNLWEIAPVPGTMLNGEIARYQPVGGGSCVILEKSSKHDKVWEFIKWWMSTEVQVNFSQQVRAMWGNSFIWSSANVDAFRGSAYSVHQKAIVLEQWNWIVELPKIPGWYMVERELSNAWNYIIFDGINVRRQVDIAAMNANREIERKLTEFGYMQNSKLVREYKIITGEDIAKWKI